MLILQGGKVDDIDGVQDDADQENNEETECQGDT